MTKQEKVFRILQESYTKGFVYTPEQLEEHLRMIADHIVNSIKYRTRSQKQNQYYWGVIIQMTADYFGYEPEEMHDAWRYMFLRTGSPDGPPIARRTSDINFTTEEAEQYYERIRRYMLMEHSFTIPLPNEV